MKNQSSLADTKDDLFRNMARIGQAFASPQRLRLLSLLAHSSKTVERLAELTDQSEALASVHLKVLRAAGLVEAEKDGRHLRCRLASDQVGEVFLSFRNLAEELLPEVREVVSRFRDDPSSLSPFSARELRAELRAGRVRLIDLRPDDEYAAGHLPGATSLPFPRIADEWCQLPAGKKLLAYCRGPYCIMAFEGVKRLRECGVNVRRLAISVPEWRAAGYRVEAG